MHKVSIVQSSRQKSENIFDAVFLRFQAIDFKRNLLCFPFDQFIETRADTGADGCQEGVIHKVIHRFCG